MTKDGISVRSFMQIVLATPLPWFMDKYLKWSQPAEKCAHFLLALEKLIFPGCCDIFENKKPAPQKVTTSDDSNLDLDEE